MENWGYFRDDEQFNVVLYVKLTRNQSHDLKKFPDTYVSLLFRQKNDVNDHVTIKTFLSCVHYTSLDRVEVGARRLPITPTAP